MKRTDREIKKRRKALGLSVELAAGKAKLSFATWNRLESGGPKPSATMSTMQAVADVLKCTVGDLT